VHIRAATIETTGQQDGHVAEILRHVSVGRVAISDIMFRNDLTADCDDVGNGYYVQLPLLGRLQSRHRGTDVTVTSELASLYVPGGGTFHGRWAAGTRVLCVRLEQAAVAAALTALPGGPPTGTLFELAMSTRHGYGQAWARLLLALSRQPAGQDGLLAHPLVAAPLADSLARGFVLAAVPCSGPLAATASAVRPASIRTAVELIEADPQAPLTVSSLAVSCGVSVRTLQSGFRRHVGTSPMGYLRDVRLRRADAELRAADPSTDTVAFIARRWGFAHLGRFAAAYEARYGQTPGRTLRDAR
jgi:AraC-like DNA-binding protein